HRTMKQWASASDTADTLHRPAVEVARPYRDGESARRRHRPIVGEVAARPRLDRHWKREVERRTHAEARNARVGIAQHVEHNGASHWRDDAPATILGGAARGSTRR